MNCEHCSGELKEHWFKEMQTLLCETCFFNKFTNITDTLKEEK